MKIKWSLNTSKKLNVQITQQLHNSNLFQILSTLIAYYRQMQQS